ncbi:unnamed protein product [Bathycoccus prasinos]|mmetsp:Transcript_7546/g.24939  ORF Transcript_7546/g.24939 Transcript_7546/m.24939 type:complete len:955 (+) Transcript_7546:223-3087(+)
MAMTLDEEDKIEEETPPNDENNTNACRWQDVPLIPQLVGTVSPCSWYSEKDGCIYSWGGQSGEGEEASREEMKVLDLVGGEFAHWTFHVENSPNPDAFPSFCARELKTSSRKKTTKKKKNEKEEEDEVLTFLSGGAEEGENGGASDDHHPSTSGSKTVARTYDSALKKWTILEPAADRKINAVPDERFGASSTFISDQKVVQFGGVKKRIPPLKPKRICGPHLIKESDLPTEHEAAMKKQNAAYTNETYIFDFKSNTWNHVRVPVRKCPPARAFASLISVTDDVAFLFGGVDAAGRCFNDVWKFDFKNKNEPWKEILAEKEAHEMIPPRMLHAVCALPDGDGMLVVGGRGSKNECLGDAWIFSCEFSVWQKLPEYMSPKMGVFGARLVPARSAVFRIGGAFADEVEGNQVMIEESNVTGTNTAASSQKKKKKSKFSAVELSTTNSGASFFAGAGLTHGNELTNPELFDDDDKKENLWDDVFPLKDCWDADAAALTTDLKTRKKKKSAGGDMKLPSVSITPTKTKKDLSISTKKSTEVQPSLEQSSGRENANNVTSIATTETPRAGVRSAFEPVKGSQAFKVDGRSAPPPAAPVANCEFCVVEFKGKTRNQMLMKHREECSKNPKNIIGEATEKIALSFSKADRLLGLPKLKVQKSAAPKSHGGDLPSLSPRASREEVLVPGVRPAPLDDEDEDKVNAVKKKKMKKQPSKLGRSSSSQMKVASAGSGEVGGKSSGGDAPNNNAAAAAAGAKKNEEKEKATTTTPANNEKSMPPKKRKLAEDGATQKNETTEEEREALRNEECYQRVMQRSVNLPRLHNASGALTVSEADLMKSFAQLANMKEDAFKIMDNKMKAEEKEIWDGAAKHLANAMQSKDYDKLFKELSTNGTTTTTSPYKKAKGGGKLPAIGSKVDSSKSKITGTFDAGYFVELVIDGKKCSGIAFSPVLKTTTIGGKQ